MLLYCLFEYKRKFFEKFKKNAIKGFMIGPFGYFFYSVGLMQSFRAFDSASETTILNYTWPIFTVVITELFFRKKSQINICQRIIESFGIALGFLSIIVVATQGNIKSFEISNIRGLLWGLSSGVSYGIFSSYSSKITNEDRSAFLFSSILVSLVLISIFSIQEINLIPTFTINDIIIVCVLGCLLNGIGYITWTSANRLAREMEISISAIASLMFLLPLLSLVMITIFLKENTLFALYFLLSLVFIILSGVLSQKPEIIADRICGGLKEKP